MTTDRPPDGYHEGELLAQSRAGLRPQAHRMLAVIGDALPRGLSGFLGAQQVLFVGAKDGAGQVWASAIYGEPGFLTLPDPHTLAIAALPYDADPLAKALRSPTKLGTLAVDFPHRRRLRVNGLANPAQDGLVLSVHQAYGNCPQYIQRRTPGTGRPGVASRLLDSGDSLDERQRDLVATADTFFIASASAAGDADVSHRGGNTGFVRVASPTRLVWPDYAGNTMLMTLGNVTANPGSGLLFVDWSTGTCLHLTGTARVDWDPEAAAGVPGAERIVTFDVLRTVLVEHLGAPSWSAPDFSRFNPPVTPSGA